MTKSRVGRGYTENGSYYTPSYAPSMASSKRASLLSVASSLFRTKESSGRPVSPAHSSTALPDLIEIAPHNDEDNERERLREIAARAIGVLPTESDINLSPANQTLDPIPPFPTSRAKIPPSAIILSTNVPLQKHYPSTSLRMFMAKTWKPRHLILSHQPNALWLLHTFREELEVERLEIIHTSFISVADESIGGKRGGVIAVAGDVVGKNIVTVWHFHIPDSKEAQRWIDQVKSAILELRSLRESIPLSMSGLHQPTFFSPHRPPNPIDHSPLPPAQPVGDMDTVLSMRKQGLLTIGSLSPTRSTFSTSTDGGEGHRNSNSLSSKASISTTQREKDKGSVHALKGLFTYTSTSNPQTHSRNLEATKHHNRQRSPSTATSIRSFLSSPHPDDQADDRTPNEGLLSGWARPTSPLPQAHHPSNNKRLPISGTPGHIAPPIMPQLDRRISETHYHHPDEPSWVSPPLSPTSSTYDTIDFAHPFANGGQSNSSPSAAEILARVNQRASAYSTTSRPALASGPTVLQPPPRRISKSSTGSILPAPTSFKEEGGRVTTLNNASLTGLGVTSLPEVVAEEDEKHIRDLTFGRHNRQAPPSSTHPTPPLPIPIPIQPPSPSSAGFMPSLTPPSSSTMGRNKRFSRQVASCGGNVPIAKAPPLGPLPDAPDCSEFTSSPPAFQAGSSAISEHPADDEFDRPISPQNRLSPGGLTSRSMSMSSHRPGSVTISVSSFEPSSADDAMSTVEDIYPNEEDEKEERRSVLPTLPTFGAPISRGASTGSGSGLGGGYYPPPPLPIAIVARDSFDGSGAADTLSLISEKGSFGQESVANLRSISGSGSGRGQRSSIPPPQRGPAPVLPLPAAPGSPEPSRSSMEDSRSSYSGFNTSGSRRLSAISLGGGMSSANDSASSTDLLPPGATTTQRLRDRAARLSMTAAPKPPPSMALPDIPPTVISPAVSLPVLSASSATTLMPAPQTHKEGFGVGRQLSKRLRILSAPNASPLFDRPLPSPPPTTERPSTESSKSIQTPSSTTSSFLHLHTPLSPNIPIPKVHSGSGFLEEPTIIEGLSPPPVRRSSWGLNNKHMVSTLTTTPMMIIPLLDGDEDGTIGVTNTVNENGGGLNTPTPTTSMFLKGTGSGSGREDTVSIMTNEDREKPKSTASSVISLRVQV